MAALPFRLRLPVWAQDLLIGVFVAAMQVQGTRSITTDEDLAQLSQVGVYTHAVLLVVGGLSLTVRRRWPVPVFALEALASIVYYGSGYPDGPNWIGVFVALYTVTAYGDGRRSSYIALGGIGVLIAGWLVAAGIHPPNDVGWLAFRIGTAIMAAVLGESVRMRRVIAAEALERAERAERTKDEEARRRVDAERLHIAREVHDTVAHAISVINVQAGVTAHVLDRRPQQVKETLLTIEQTSARALRELRATLGVLRESDDGRAPIPGLDRVEELASVAREAGLDVKVDVPAPPREVPGAVDRAAYRIVQESITNVIRHAGPARVTVAVAYQPDDLRIRVTDTGRGGDCAGAAGRGIAGMRERCALLGGELAAGPRSGGGFEVYARLPLPAAAGEP
ncbi:sensor histidine kinase [Phytohabitans rumicis]|uniref:histidine kinase n=1 Tax=Phytohabitans rumicis TaxID=1076125 RepID=A0A6V8L9N1_9ACTN|nr:histidine kinase [Phytohabitans rumicis]GFJ89415.1 two-component sensor histidine kinase [Phytohabitans rumicis]